MKIKLKNISQVPVMGKLPGAEFRVEAIDENTPKDGFWRKRLKDDDGIVIVEDTVGGHKRETLTLNQSKKQPQKDPIKNDSKPGVKDEKEAVNA